MTDPRPLALLYAESGRREGRVGVVLAHDGDRFAVFSPWPLVFDGRNAFAVLVIDPTQAPAFEAWSPPAEVFVFRLDGAEEDTQVGVVRLQNSAGIPAAPAPVSRADFSGRLSSGSGVVGSGAPVTIRSVLIESAGDFFRPLDPRTPTPALPGDQDASATARVPDSHRVETGDAAAVALSICSLFHWD